MAKIKFSLLLITIATFSIALPQLVSAIGQLTEPIVLEDVLRSQEVTAVLTLLNSEDREVIYALEAEGEIANWASFYKIEDKNLENPITEIETPADSWINVIVKLEVPEDVPNGRYSGQVTIIGMPGENEKTEGLSAAVKLSVSRDVQVTVTDKEIINFETIIIPTKHRINQGESLQIKVIYDNQGNVTIKPNLQLKITLLSTGNVVHNAIYPYPEDEEPVKPFERKILPDLIKWQTAGQENGKYKAEITVLLDGEKIEDHSFNFQIGTDMSKFLAAIAVIGGGNLLVAWFIIGGFFAVLAGILALFYKKPQVFKAGLNKIKSIF